MSLQYRFALTRDSHDEVIYEESPDYGNALSLLAIGAPLVTIALLGLHWGASSSSRGKLLGAAFSTGVLFCIFAPVYFTTSKIVFDRRRQTLTVARRWLLVRWVRQYKIADIEHVYEGESAQGKGLGLQLSNVRTKKLNLWIKKRSFSTEESYMNEVLRRFASQPHKPMTEDEWWARTKNNASIDLKRSLRRTLFTLGGFFAVPGSVVPFLAAIPCMDIGNVSAFL